eukprot:Tbor_TRINITY_DN4443_c0_g1::TRINITY_DN4443_c0_g1_i1::g.7898::m.7898
MDKEETIRTPAVTNEKIMHTERKHSDTDNAPAGDAHGNGNTPQPNRGRNHRNNRGRGRGRGAVKPANDHDSEQHQDPQLQDRAKDNNGDKPEEAQMGRGHGRGRGGHRSRGRGRGGNRGGRDNMTKEEVPVENTTENEPENKKPKSPPPKRSKPQKKKEKDTVPAGRPALVKSRNTEEFTPSHECPSMRLICDISSEKYGGTPISVRDITYCPCIFNKEGDSTIYSRLMEEIEAYKPTGDPLLKSWHGDTHWIADDSAEWKKECSVFNSVVDRITQFFGMKVNATRLNMYKDTSEWKPFHHDAAALKPHIAKKQNFTAAVSFGATRTVAFEHAKSREVISFPQGDGTVYCIARDANILWRHGILQEKEENQKKEGRISIILWGWIDQEEVC